MTEDERAELERLRAENAALKSQRPADGGMSRLLQAARREAGFANRDFDGGVTYDNAYPAAEAVMRDMGLI